MPVIVSGNNKATVVLDKRTVAQVNNTQNALQLNNSGILGVAVERTNTTNAASAGIRGEKGEPGAGGDKIIIARTTPVATSGHKIVYAASSNSALVASSDDLINSDNVLGITVNATGAGETAQVQTYGPITEPGWSWTQGEPLFLSLIGMMSHIPPVTGVQIPIGFAESPTTVFIDIGTPIYLED